MSLLKSRSNDLFFSSLVAYRSMELGYGKMSFACWVITTDKMSYFYLSGIYNSFSFLFIKLIISGFFQNEPLTSSYHGYPTRESQVRVISVIFLLRYYYIIAAAILCKSRCVNMGLTAIPSHIQRKRRLASLVAVGEG